MEKRNPFLHVIVRSFTRRRRVPPLPIFVTPCRQGRAGRGSELPLRSENWFEGAVAPAITTIITCFVLAISAHARVVEVGPIDLSVASLERELPFYTNTLPFRVVGFSKNADVRKATLQLGAERIQLVEHANPGRPIPVDSRSYDRWFQHIAIVVHDMDEAYAQLRAHKVQHVSTAPQTLPEWNKNAAGIKAFYFRDPEDHVLEIINFPSGKGDPRWQLPTTNIFLGIDHTAIVVSDTEGSLAFYRDKLGMRVAGASENYGVEQEHLNQVFGARLRITALRAEHGPGIEFLEYIAPPGGRPYPVDAKSNDLIFWNTHLITDTTGAANIVADPDGHRVEVDPSPTVATK